MSWTIPRMGYAISIFSSSRPQQLGMLHASKQLWRPWSFKHLLVAPRLCPGVGHRLFLSVSYARNSANSSSRDWGSLIRPTILSWSIREAHSGTAGKSHGRRKKSVQTSLLRYTKRGDALEERTEEETSEDYEGKDSKGQSKRKSLRALEWGNRLASLSPSQLRQAIRCASLDEEVYDAVMLVKSLGPNVRNGKRRQFNFIGGLLREADPELMEQVLTACQDGDLSGFMARTKSGPIAEEIDEDEISDEKAEFLSEEDKIATQWLRGLLGGDEVVNNDVFSSTSDVYFDRQELKKLLRMAKGSQTLKSTDSSVEATKARNTLFEFLHDLAQRRQNGA